ncbi:hypothetical protein [Pedobacter frigoris]|uniref:Uncharacterized protein n=1 Tax=Pedobacter frigoris TaxID=2571272 RepID=A0A4V5P1Y4_9SPHI|nr:hypothetical protein [Pedobacter frigoris]TKC09092.1 hypothetical protein FA047_03075 [Pedobacter frigoris]
MKYRAVYWICFPVLAALLFIVKYNRTGIEQTLTDAGFSLSFLLVQLFILWGYFSIKHKRAINITKDYLGWGDVLFLITIVCYLSPVNYVLFYVGSLILVLFYVITANLLSTKVSQQIPLAGLQAALLAVLMAIEIYSPTTKLYDDSWIYYLVG